MGHFKVWPSSIIVSKIYSQNCLVDKEFHEISYRLKYLPTYLLVPTIYKNDFTYIGTSSSFNLF